MASLLPAQGRVNPLQIVLGVGMALQSNKSTVGVLQSGTT